ncbi:hypothetical protein KY290_036323 [Solanum tuberosum]|uniref:Protein kinase domain-containing protein n=1 Tax=Solanum tuberosum TaxID=4113 RepID=A0ABQ7TTW8_SOLTU|nr:hypothetical protein KY290_036323 [Solanum tuberosum]
MQCLTECNIAIKTWDFFVPQLPFYADHPARFCFGWDGRMKVATQLASLFVWFHEKRYAFGTVRPKDIMIDKDFNIKVFDFGFLTSVTNEDNWGPLPYRAIREPPEARYEPAKL